MYILKKSISLFLLILLTSCANVWVHKDFDSMKGNIQTITIMPPQIEYYERSAASTEPKPERNSEVIDNVQTCINEVLVEHGYTVKPAELTDSVLIDNQDLALLFTRTQKEISAICDSIDRLNLKKETYKINPEIGVFADRADVDHLLFSHGKAYGTTGGAKATDIALAALASAFGMYASTSKWEGLFLELVLVDANRAETIWYSGFTKMEEINPFNHWQVKAWCKKLLEQKLEKRK
jgi:hypothetical protein